MKFLKLACLGLYTFFKSIFVLSLLFMKPAMEYTSSVFTPFMFDHMIAQVEVFEVVKVMVHQCFDILILHLVQDQSFFSYFFF